MSRIEHEDADGGQRGAGEGAGVATDDPAPDAGGEPALSVVVVTRNEADRIDACIESIFAACEAVPSFEVILVDSNSDDGTVDRASTYPITVLSIPSDDLSTPAAGRYVGTRHASANRILFVDGDMVLTEDWLPAALDRLAAPDVAAVDGWLGAPGEAAVPESETATAVDAVRGVALYDAAALAAVGGFEPSLQSLEDIHLGFELTAAGYRLLRLPRVAATHPPRPPVTEPFRRWRQGYAVGTGQAVRTSLGSPSILARHLYRMRHRFAVSLWLALGAAAFRDRTRLVAWLVLSAVGFLAVARELGPLGAITFGLDKVLGTVGVAVGVWHPPSNRDDYPLSRVATVARGQVHGDVQTAAETSVGGE